jgi:signal transduction histidine kinase
MTAATSVVVAVTLCIYAVIDLRADSSDREESLREHARDLAATFRSQVEKRGPITSGETARRVAMQFEKAVSPWKVDIWLAELAEGSPQTERGQRIKALVEGRPPYLLTMADGRLIYTVPLLAPSKSPVEGYDVWGGLEVSTYTTRLDRAFADDLGRTLILLAIVAALVLVAVYLLARRVVTQPLAKLLTGIDEVAHGDLSRVVLSEREDEVGSLAARFNEMTYSLRESRGETERQNKARAQLEERLFQTEKLATIGQIAAEIAHEVGTPLNVIAGRARGMARKAENPQAVEKSATIIAEQTSRITRIIQRLLDFSRRKVGVPELEDVNLNTIALSTMEFLESKLTAAAVKHKLSRAEGLPAVKGNSDQLQQVLMNLILNAIQAMPDGGSLSVETQLVTRRRPGLEMAPEQRMVVVTVSDTGAGISEEELDKIFEPFYSSRTREGGTGLGLAVVHGIVKEHDGWIEVHPGAAGGTEFQVYLPAADE